MPNTIAHPGSQNTGKTTIHLFLLGVDSLAGCAINEYERALLANNLPGNL